MNKVILMGRLTRDPDIRQTQGDNATSYARFTIAVDRRFKRDGDQSADFIGCVAWGKTAEFAEKYLKQGTKICVEGRIQTGSYTNRDGQKVYTTDVVVEQIEFAESKSASQGGQSYSAPAQPQQRQNTYSAPAAPSYQQSAPQDFMTPPQESAPRNASAAEGFMSIQDGLDDEGLPFN